MLLSGHHVILIKYNMNKEFVVFFTLRVRCLSYLLAHHTKTDSFEIDYVGNKLEKEEDSFSSRILQSKLTNEKGRINDLARNLGQSDIWYSRDKYEYCQARFHSCGE